MTTPVREPSVLNDCIKCTGIIREKILYIESYCGLVLIGMRVQLGNKRALLLDLLSARSLPLSRLACR